MNPEDTNTTSKEPEIKPGQNRPQDINKLVEDLFLRYSLSVITARALPDVRDGLKPVQRRILYTMHRNGLKSGGKTSKCALIVGDVMGKYHPHGEEAIYDALARLAIDWGTRYTLVAGQGNFGTMDGDPPAAKRYTEAKLSKPAEALLEDLDKETVDFVPNYDETKTEPRVLPAKIPNLLVNGQMGIAVGMATSIPPHNLGEIIEAALAIIDNPETTISDLMKIVKGPDFPTGGIVYTGAGLRQAYETGRGRVVVRGRAEIKETEGKKQSQIIISEVPYNTNIANMIEKMADLVRAKKVNAISDIRDESSRGKIRVVIDLKKDSYPKKVLNQLYQLTPLQNYFHYNMMVLVDGIQPKVLNLPEIIKEHLKHRQEVVRRRVEFELKKAQEREHILEGLNLALDQIDEVIATIRKSKTTLEAKEQLIKRFKLSEIQAAAILAMQLRTLAGLERQKIIDELKDIKDQIKKYEEILSSVKNILDVVRQELVATKEAFADQRRSQIVPHELGQFKDEDLIPNEQVVVTMTTINYIKRSPIGYYKKQHRGGKGRRGMETREEDIIQQMVVAQTHDSLLFFTNQGRTFKLRCYEIPESGLGAKGLAIANLLQLAPNETVSTILKMDNETPDDNYLFMCTKKGVVKKTAYSHYRNLKGRGLITINLDKDDELKWVRLSNSDNEVVISTANGLANRFHEKDVRPIGRSARGVRGIRLKNDDVVVGMDIVEPGIKLFVISQKGYGKKTDISNFTPHKRGGQGVKAAVVNKETGKIVAVKGLSENTTEVIAISAAGKTIRTELKTVRSLGRNTKGVKIMRLEPKDIIVSSVLVEKIENGEPKKDSQASLLESQTSTETNSPKTKESQSTKK